METDHTHLIATKLPSIIMNIRLEDTGHLTRMYLFRQRKAVGCLLRYAGEFVDDVEFSCEDAGRSDMGFLKEISDAVIDAGAKTS